jgi:hypothetical protein
MFLLYILRWKRSALEAQAHVRQRDPDARKTIESIERSKNRDRCTELLLRPLPQASSSDLFLKPLPQASSPSLFLKPLSCLDVYPKLEVSTRQPRL